MESVSDFTEFTYGNIIIGKVENFAGNALKQLADDLAADLEGGLVLLLSNLGEKVVIVCKSNSIKFDAGKLVKEAAMVCDGFGGGRPDFAQAGGKDPSKIDLAIERIKDLVL